MRSFNNKLNLCVDGIFWCPFVDIRILYGYDIILCFWKKCEAMLLVLGTNGQADSLGGNVDGFCPFASSQSVVGSIACA